MKILKIENNRGFFNCNNKDWVGIDLISKEHLLILVNLVLKDTVELDAFDATKIDNQAHQIIYKSIWEKLSALMSEKTKFKDESERLYLKEIEKYKGDE